MKRVTETNANPIICIRSLALFGVSFNGKLSSRYSSLATGPYDYRNVKETSSAVTAGRTDILQNLSVRLGHAFRINGKTYYEKR